MLFVLLFILTSSVVLYLPLYAAETTYQHPTHHLTLTSPPPIQKRNAPPPSTSYAQNSFKTAEQHYFKDSLNIQSISWEDVQAISYDESPDQLFNNFSYYANPYYLHLIRQKQGYEDFILNLHQRYTDDHDYRKFLRCIKGFYPYEFLKLIDSEHDRIKALQQEREQLRQATLQKKIADAKRHCLQINNTNEYQIFIKHCEQDIKNAEVLDIQSSINRYKKRITAAQKALDNHTIYDYSAQLKSYPVWNDPDATAFNNCIGTALDQQLHEELCDTRLRMHELTLNHSTMDYGHIYTPIVFRCTALAKQERNLSSAFGLSNFSDAVVRILSRGIQFISHVSSGPIKGLKMIAQDVSSSKYWTELVTAMPNFIINVLPTLLAQSPELLKQGIIFAAHEQSFWDRLDQTYILGDYELLDKRSKAYAEESREQLKPIDKRFKQLASMPWEDIGKYGTYYGSRLILDAIACRAFTLAASAAGREITCKIATFLESSRAPEQLVEVAGIGKIAINDGIETANKVINVIKENTTDSKAPKNLITQYAKQIAKNAANESGRAFEESLIKRLGGKGSFKIGGREFDGAVGNIWYEAKSGQYWNMISKNKEKLNKFKSQMGSGLKIAREHGASYELYTNTLIPADIKAWLTMQGIPFKEFLEGI